MQSQSWLPVVLGFVMGMRHAFEPDHLAAVGALSAGESKVRRLTQLGGLWGAGHLSTVTLGVIILTTLRVTLRTQHLLWFELPVAFMLLALGASTFARTIGQRGSPTAVPPPARRPVSPLWWSYVAGLVHGLAGTGALVILVAGTFPDVMMGYAYVILFGTGAMLGMALITSVLAFPLSAVSRWPLASRGLTAVTGLYGILIAFTIFTQIMRAHG